ncbi:hypothetical protein [Arthrospiribacter ruber]|uniref:Lipoprotein n=1 Tax=Arthrospiribacter ruber TaxID=2487934 RepID=A0A951IZ08_9BACT|nr:hypothetical protein [Arthrospiribacter ruber]MBW3469012.1 hypothetical protein [Arthrospiribacter ruber]
MKQFKYFMWSIFLTFLACKPEKTDNRLLGNWYGFDADSSYYELYISDTVIILNHEKLGLAEYVYEKDGDKLVTTTPLFFERVWNLDSLTDSTVVISDTLEVHHFFKMHYEVDYFSSLRDSIEFYRFREAFITRNPRIKDE